MAYVVDRAVPFRHRRLAGIAVLAVVLGLCASGAARAADEGGGKQPVYIGAIYNLTGSQAGLDRPSARGAELAVREANANGGVLRRPIRLIVRDGHSALPAVARATESLLHDYPRVAVLMGLSDTDMVSAAAPIAARADRAFLTSGATSPRLPSSMPDHLMLACFGDNTQAAAAAEWLRRDRHARTVSVLFDSRMSYTILLHRYFDTKFRGLGGRVLAIVSYRPGTLAKAVAGVPKADAVYVAAGPDEAGRAVSLLRAAGHVSPIVGGDSFDVGGLWRSLPKLTGIYFTTHAYIAADNPNPRVVAFRKAYKALYPGKRPDAFAALGYDAARLLISAIRAAGSDEHEHVRAALAATVEFEGVTGKLGYTPGNFVPQKDVTIVGVSRGTRSLVKQFVPDRVPPP